jgi:hypothetical protein
MGARILCSCGGAGRIGVPGVESVGVASRSSVSRLRQWGPLAGAVAVVSMALIGIGLIWLASEAHYSGCVARANAEFPAVPVSAFAGSRTATGPVKVSFVQERAKAVKDCSHF